VIARAYILATNLGLVGFALVFPPAARGDGLDVFASIGVALLAVMFALFWGIDRAETRRHHKLERTHQ